MTLGQRAFAYTTAGICALVATWIASGWYHERYMLGANLTDSLPQHLFLVKKGERPAPGDFIAFAVSGNARQYPAGTVFIKVAVAVGGAKVEHRNGHAFVDGIDRGIIKTIDRKGQPLAEGRTGVIPEGAYYVWTPHSDSYDSRYSDIGFPGQDSGLVGKAYAIF